MTITTFEEAQQSFAASLPGYTRRPHQIRLAEAVEKTVAEGGHGLFQAGTGTGKSLVLMIAAILSGKRTIVGTPTKALQDQYVKDVTFLAEYLGVPFTWANLKGRANYPCVAKAREIGNPTPQQAQVLYQVEKLTTREAILAGEIIDRESFPDLREEEWRPFSMSTGECPGASHCPFADRCFAERAKIKAASASIVITNLTYLLLDAKLRLETADNVALLGDYQQVIADEGHMLPETATKALEDTMGQGSFAVLARDMAAYLEEAGRDSGEAAGIERAAEELWDVITATYAESDKDGKHLAMKLKREELLDLDRYGRFFSALINAIDKARGDVKSARPWDEKSEAVRARLMRRASNQASRIIDFVSDLDGKTVRWVEREEKGFRIRLYLRSAPISVAPFLQAALFGKVPVIISSATLASGTNFRPLMDTLGLSREDTRTYDAGSPFEYKSQALLFVPPKDAPAPNENLGAWRAYAQEMTRYLVGRSGGGALLLFTSRSAMNESWNALADSFAAKGLTVLRQDGDTPPRELIRIMKEDGNAVLFALRTFFQGVDIQGKALRLVVLDKLPFTPPTDVVHAARCDAAERRYGRWGPMDHIMVPGMILDLNQAYGRLIRHRDDKGVVAILDCRLVSKGYGAKVRQALPPAPMTHDPEVAGDFLEAAARR
ncbi:MAG: ATP-dependent helicase [Actinomycetia bacterium]|nr:ATP-dependent helicase [Actinomycetes bacterium]